MSGSEATTSTAPAVHYRTIPLDAYWPTILNEIEGGRSLREIMDTPASPAGSGRCSVCARTQNCEHSTRLPAVVEQSSWLMRS